MIRLRSGGAAALALLLTLCGAMARAEDAEVTITARLFRVKTVPFEKGLSDEKRLALRLVFDRDDVATLEALLKESGGKCVATARAKQAPTLALADRHTEAYVRDMDLEIDSNGVRGEPVKGEFTWGLMLNASGVEMDGARNVKMTLTGSACLPHAERRTTKTEGGNVDLPGFATLSGSIPLVVPPGGAAILGASDLEDPAHTVVLVVGTDAEPTAANVANGGHGVALWWLDLPGKDADALLKAAPQPPAIGPDQAARARKARARLWAFAPTCDSALVLDVSSDQAIVRDYDEEMAGGTAAWDTVIGGYQESVHIRLEGTKIKLDAEVVDRPIAEKKVADGKKKVPDPVRVSVAAGSDAPLEPDEGDWLLQVRNPMGIPLGALLVSLRGRDR